MIIFLCKMIMIWMLATLPGCMQSQTEKHLVPEFFMTDRNAQLNVDSVAVWHAADGRHWLVATAKAGHTLPVYDATTGHLIKTIGEPGLEPSQLRRPNGIAIEDDLLFIIERDNKRLQIFGLPDGNHLCMTDGVMQKPYGIAVVTIEPHKQYMVYVTDNGGPRDNHAKKIHQYQVTRSCDRVKAKLVNTFGDEQGDGMLWKVESIAADAQHNRLFIADEHEKRKNVKIYTLDGIFTGKTIGDGLIAHEPEGIALYHSNDKEGYVVVTDQDRQENQFWLFDRVTLEPITSFEGNHTRNTDGIAITNLAFGPFERGAFYAVHDDGNIHAYDWKLLAESCGLPLMR